MALSALIDATIVRMILVPCVMTLLGDWCWYCPAPLKAAVNYLGLQEAKIEDVPPPAIALADEGKQDDAHGNTTTVGV